MVPVCIAYLQSHFTGIHRTLLRDCDSVKSSMAIMTRTEDVAITKDVRLRAIEPIVRVGYRRRVPWLTPNWANRWRLAACWGFSVSALWAAATAALGRPAPSCASARR